MSLLSLQLDVGQAGIFLFEKAVALSSYWLSQGIAGHGWDGLAKSIQSLPITQLAARRANKRIKGIQSQSKHFGSWVMGTRKGDMIGVLNEQEATWPMVALLLPLAAVLSSEDAADVLVDLSEAGASPNNLQDSEALAVSNKSAGDSSKPLSYEVAHSIVKATTPYVGAGFEQQEFSKTLKLVLEAFDSRDISLHIANCCRWRPAPNDITSFMREIASASSTASTEPSGVVVTTNRGVDVLCYLAILLFDCSVSISFNNIIKPIAIGKGPLVTIVVLPPGEKQSHDSQNYANARIGVRDDAKTELQDSQWGSLETRWTLSDYILLRLTSWVIGQHSIEEFEYYLADHVLSFYWHGHVYGAVASQFGAGLVNAKVDHSKSQLPPSGPAIRTLFTIDQIISRIRAFDNTLGDIVALRADVDDPAWKKEESCWATLSRDFMAFCPCHRHNGTKSSPSVRGQGCIMEKLGELERFIKGALRTIIFISAPKAHPGLPLNCSHTTQKLVSSLPFGRHRGEKLDLAHILESAALLLGNLSTGSLAASQDVIGVSASGCCIVPNMILSTSIDPADNLIFNVSPGGLYCRGVEVTSLRNSSWATSGYYALGGEPIPSDDITILPAEMFDSEVLADTGASRSHIFVEASLKDKAGYLSVRVDWNRKGQELSEHIAPTDILYGMSNVPIAPRCPHVQPNGTIAPFSSDRHILVANAGSIYFNPLDTWNYKDHSYAGAKSLEEEDCLGDFDGVIVMGKDDRGMLLRAIRYDSARARMGKESCLACAVAFAVSCKATLLYVE